MDPNCENARRSDPSTPTTPQPDASNDPMLDDFLLDLPLSSLDEPHISDADHTGLVSPRDDGPSESMDSFFDEFPPDPPIPSIFGPTTPAIPEFVEDNFVSPPSPPPVSTGRGARKSRTPHTPLPTPELTHNQLPKILSAESISYPLAPMVPFMSSVQASQTPHTPQPTPNPPHAELPDPSTAESAPNPTTLMVPPSVTKTPIVESSTGPQVPFPSSVSPASAALPIFKTPTPIMDMRAHTGLDLPFSSPTPSAGATPFTNMRAQTDLPLPLVSPTPSTPSTVSTQNSSKLSNLNAFQKSQALFQRNQAAKKALADQAASGSSGSSKPATVSVSQSKKRSYETSLEDDRDFMANLAQGDGEDNSWMMEIDEDEDEELTTLTEQFQVLNAKNKRGALSGNERMQLIKIEGRLLQINRLRRGDQDEEDEDPASLFIPESRDAVIARHRQKKVTVLEESDIDDDDIRPEIDDEMRPEVDENDTILLSMIGHAIHGSPEPDRGLKKNGEPKKRRGPIPKTPRDIYAHSQEKLKEKELKKLQKKKANPPISASASKAKSKGKGKGKESAKNSAKSKKSTKKGKGKEKVVNDGPSLLRSSHSWKDNEDSVAEGLLRSLAQSDPISDRMNNPIFDIGAEPELQGRFTKNTQFSKLFANIPEGSSVSQARSDKQKLLKASKSMGYRMVTARGGKWHLKGMSDTTLYHHQLLGAQWMLERELASTSPHGGILADSMGLGKTVETLAVMIANSPEPGDIKRGVKATLIVAPASVVNQWVEEIAHHTDPSTFPKVIKYKTSSHLSINVLKDADVVVTSYHEIMKQFPYPDAEAKKEIDIIGEAAWWKKAMDNLGPLHQVNWYRVVLDEAHAIKNNAARTSLACQNLKSVYRWCLTGTPLMNRLEELFPYLRFLKADFTVDFKSFQRYFCDGNSQDCHARIATLLSFAMIRRTMNTQIFGRAILTLPKPQTEVRRIKFSRAESIIYRISESRFRSTLNRFFKQGDAARNYSVFMVQLLRLRQCTSHPFMLEQTIRESWTLEDVHQLKHRLSQLKTVDLAPFYKQVECWVEEREQTEGGETEVLPFGFGTYGHTFDFAKVLDTLNEVEMAERTTCGVCNDLPVEGKQTPCHHIFCGECIMTAMHECLATSEYTVCPTCDKVFDAGSLKDVQAVDRSAHDADDSRSNSSGDRRSKKRKIAADSKGIDMLGHEPWTDSTWLPRSDDDINFPLTPSSKTAALKTILLKGFHDAPLDKVVVYVQFRTLARIVARICKSENWGFLYLTGDTTQEHRAKVVTRFRTDPDAKILIAGLKCGGLGMNFQWANRAISLDLWWNHAVEQQAFGRIFRIGQDKVTHFTRIAVLNTVDIRILNMQLSKLETIERAITDGPSNQKPNLTLHQLANLFGFLRTDEDNNILSIEPDYDDADEWEAAGRRPETAGSGGSRDSD